MKAHYILLICLSFSLNLMFSNASEIRKSDITIHVAGEVNKPGKFSIKDKITLEELSLIVGGWSEWANLEKIVIVRFPRREGLEDEGELVKESFLRIKDINEEGESLSLKEGDIIYVPMKAYMGK